MVVQANLAKQRLRVSRNIHSGMIDVHDLAAVLLYQGIHLKGCEIWASAMPVKSLSS